MVSPHDDEEVFFDADFWRGVARRIEEVSEYELGDLVQSEVDEPSFDLDEGFWHEVHARVRDVLTMPLELDIASALAMNPLPDSEVVLPRPDVVVRPDVATLRRLVAQPDALVFVPDRFRSSWAISGSRLSDLFRVAGPKEQTEDMLLSRCPCCPDDPSTVPKPASRPGTDVGSGALDGRRKSRRKRLYRRRFEGRAADTVAPEDGVRLRVRWQLERLSEFLELYVPLYDVAPPSEHYRRSLDARDCSDVFVPHWDELVQEAVRASLLSSAALWRREGTGGRIEQVFVRSRFDHGADIMEWDFRLARAMLAVQGRRSRRGPWWRRLSSIWAGDQTEDGELCSIGSGTVFSYFVDDDQNHPGATTSMVEILLDTCISAAAWNAALPQERPSLCRGRSRDAAATWTSSYCLAEVQSSHQWTAVDYWRSSGSDEMVDTREFVDRLSTAAQVTDPV